MGSDKALLRTSETTLLEHVSNQVRAAAGSVHVVGRTGPLPAVGIDVIEDLFPREGPFGGIITALTHSTAEWNLIVACDMPAVTAAFLKDLLKAAGRGSSVALVPVDENGRPHPLCAVYHSSAVEAFRVAWTQGVRSAVGALRSVRTEYRRYSDTEALTNVNTPADWDAFRSTIS
jgi:molybdopterin-guanine dinucleotide biosynthesis protein A